MDVSADELAGVVDLFGALTSDELREALTELAFKQGEDCDPSVFDDDIEHALATYHLVDIDAAETALSVEGTVLVAGPVAFPELPSGATDLPHILDIEQRTVDRETAAVAAQRGFEQAAATAIDEDDTDRIAALLDASYELEAWGTVDLDDARALLDDARSDE